MFVKLDEELVCVCVCVSKSVYNHLQTEPQPLRYSPFGGPTTAQAPEQMPPVQETTFP